MGKPSLPPGFRGFGMTAKICAPEHFYQDLQSNDILSRAFEGLKHICTITELEAGYPTDRSIICIHAAYSTSFGCDTGAQPRLQGQ